MKSSLTKKGIIAFIWTIGMVALIGYTMYLQMSTPLLELDINVQKIFIMIVEVIGLVARHFTFPVIVFIIILYALRLVRESRENKIGFYIGLAITVWVISMHTIGVFPAYTTSSLDISLFLILIYSFISILVGFGFLFILKAVAGTPVSGLMVALMVGAILSSFYLYYSSQSIQIHLLAIAPSLFIGGGIFEIMFKEKKES